ncbi:MAG: CoA transferase [Chloroflexi bacterium]|nr:CoA transferase [Chloroflexota bacterium]
MPSILEGIRVLDWTIFQQGPVATALLGDMGAEVIKIEERGVGDPARGMMKVIGAIVSQSLGGRNAYYENNNRNKRCIALDLTKPQAKEIIYQLVEKSDVFVQNFRKGVAEKMGMDYETLCKYNPRLIYASASGWGPEGPDANEPSADYVGIARSGFMSLAGEPDMPPQMVQGGIGDQTGAIMTAFGVVSALLARERFGVSQELNASILGGLVYLEGVPVSLSLMAGLKSMRAHRARAGNPLWNHYRCKDDKWVALSHLQPDKFWPNVCKAMDICHLQNDPKFANLSARDANRVELIKILDEVFANRTREEWKQVFKANGVMYASVNTLPDLKEDPQIIANNYITEFDHPTAGKTKTVGHPIIFDKTPMKIQREAPEFGQHTEEILTEILGYSWEQIEELRGAGVI